MNKHEGIDFEKENEMRDITEESKIEARENQRDAVKKEREEKEALIKAITDYSAQITEGKEVDEKMKFVNEVLGVENFKDLNKKTIEDLNKIIRQLEDLV